MNLRGVTGPHPFSEHVENVCILPILVSNKLDWKVRMTGKSTSTYNFMY